MEEPLILSAALIQLGRKTVQRNLPATCIAMHEVDHVVLKMVLYKDQFTGDWTSFTQKPVQSLLERPPFDQCDRSDVLDVWDRQFLSSKFTRSKPDDCQVFAANMRLTKDVGTSTMNTSGSEGLYVEPRTFDGRQPDPAYQVIWMLKKSFAEASLAQKTAPCK